MGKLCVITSYSIHYTKLYDYEVGIARFRETSRGHIMGLESGMMKMLFGLADRKLLGVHIVGEGATELPTSSGWAAPPSNSEKIAWKGFDMKLASTFRRPRCVV